MNLPIQDYEPNFYNTLYRIPILNIFLFVLFPNTFYKELAHETIRKHKIPYNKLTEYVSPDEIKLFSLDTLYKQNND